MSSPTTIPETNLINFTIKAGGAPIPGEIQVQSIIIEHENNRISSAKIDVLDGNPANKEDSFKISSSSTFVPGTEIVIEAGYDGEESVIFSGIIVGQSLRIDQTSGSVLEIECRDKAVKMIVGRKSMTFQKKKDSDIIDQIIGNYSGLTANVKATDAELPELTQYYCTDWDFILARAEVNGMVVSIFDGKVTVDKPDANTSSVLEISYGNNMLSFQASLDALTQLGEVKAEAWDYKQQQVVNGQASNSHSGPGNLSSKKLSEVVGLSEYQLKTTIPETTGDLTTWAKAQMVKSTYSKIRGTVNFMGSSLPKVGTYVTLSGLGDRFDGDHYVSGVRHHLYGGDWVTEATLGLSPQWTTSEPDVMAPPAAGLLPGARGLFNGTVKKIYEDPDSEFRVMVNVPLFDQEGEGIWARLSNFYATSGAGAFFMPEVGDEVILGFLNEDPRFPVILGSVYSSNKLKPFSEFYPNERNSKKAIVTKSEMRIVFDDENKVMTITTPSNNTVTLSDQDKQLALKDQNGNSIVMSASGISIKSPTNISIEADQNVTIRGQMGITEEASAGDVDVKGMNIKHTADMQYSAEGGMTASMTGGMEASIKGEMVMIN